ncbi:MAG: EAL domain-containing protein [Peptococcaceae bacterium]|nr:EAL domain-containing protein [Peptococcaceae bacterium]
MSTILPGRDKSLVLVVDDSKLMRLKLRRIMEDEGYTVIEAENGAQALSAFAEHHPDLILMDCVMPEMDGFAACARLQGLPGGSRTPVVMITSLEDDHAVELAFASGATDYITKPINWAVLRHRVRRLLYARQTEASLDRSEAFAQSVINHALDGIVTIDAAGTIQSFNPASERIFGFSAAEALGRNINMLIPGFFCNEFECYFAGSRHGGESDFFGRIMEVEGRRKDGSAFPIELAASKFHVDEQIMFTVILRDITERKRYEETIRHQAFHDALTGLPNRMLFKDRLTLAIAHAKRNKQILAVLFLDLDRFKLINDTLGHALGDQLLQMTAQRLMETVREDDTVARLGGDEFTLLLPGINKAENAAKVAQKVIEAIRNPFTIGQHELYITTSVGVALYPSDGEDAETLLKNADAAMYLAKEKGRNNYQLYTPAMNARAFERLELENSLRRALEKGEFVVYYQPKIKMDTGKIVGMEALVRWQHPEKGLVPPADFIPVAEETGLIIPLGEWVLRTACRQNKAWQDRGFPPMRVAVNLSARQFQLQNLVETIARILEETGLEPRWLELEITESVAMQNAEYTVKMLHELKEMGIQLSIDDFGTGYSSLSYLKRFPIDKLKIDKSFVREIGMDKDNEVIASTVIVLGKSLKIGVNAEGVENEEQLDFLKKHQCDEMQGYLFGRPVPPEEFEKLFEDRSRI